MKYEVNIGRYLHATRVPNTTRTFMVFSRIKSGEDEIVFISLLILPIHHQILCKIFVLVDMIMTYDDCDRISCTLIA